MKISKFSTVFLLTVLSSCLTYSIAYHNSYKTVKQVPVSLIIKPGVLNAVVDINPDTLNLKSQGQWITAYIELQEGYSVGDIDVSTILLNNTIPAEMRPVGIGDHDDDGIPDLMVKFEREAMIEYLRNEGIAGAGIILTITGEFNGTLFEGSDTIRVLDK